jgi:hypothetical protein
MNRSRHLVVLFCLSVLGATVPSIARAQSAAVAISTSFRATSATQSDAVSAGDRLAATATIQEVVSTHALGSPRGTRLILAGPQGLLDASVGPYLATDVQQTLAVGQSVTVDGVISTFNGHDFLLVRQLTVGDRQITIRNERGFLVHPASAGARHNEIGTKGDNQ